MGEFPVHTQSGECADSGGTFYLVRRVHLNISPGRRETIESFTRPSAPGITKRRISSSSLFYFQLPRQPHDKQGIEVAEQTSTSTFFPRLRRSSLQFPSPVVPLKSETWSAEIRELAWQPDRTAPREQISISRSGSSPDEVGNRILG